MAIEREWNVGENRLEYGIWVWNVMGSYVPPPLSGDPLAIRMPREPTFERLGFNQNSMKEMPALICSQNCRKSQARLLSIHKIGAK